MEVHMSSALQAPHIKEDFQVHVRFPEERHLLREVVTSAGRVEVRRGGQGDGHRMRSLARLSAFTVL